ncbi:MAG: abortive phage infection protein [Sphaerochaetaceae bacterium]|nr:abortive phage infection protein [Sphaerochaetaceae bacterium]
MNYLEKLEELIQKHYGTILSADLDKNQIPRGYLQMMVAEGTLERVNRGVYVSVNSIEDEMYALQTKYPNIIYSHETALFMHGLSDRTPFKYSVTVPSGHKVVGDVAERCKVYYIKREFHEMGAELAESSFGNQIRVYTIERTICDLVRSRNRVDIQIFSQALTRFAKLKSTDFSTLMDMARKLKIEAVLRTYLEVLL